MAPEVLNNSNHSYDASKADIWSFGITLIELLHGRPPLYYLSPRAAMSTIPRTSPPRLESDDPAASKTLRDLIHSCLHDDPRKRPSASQLLKSFKSYFKQQATLTGSLARLQISKTRTVDNSNDRNQAIQAAAQADTIYSQWDFDLSTFNNNGDENEEEMESEISYKANSGIICDTIYPEPAAVAKQPSSPVKSPTIQAISSSQTTIKFRRLELQQGKTDSSHSGWKDKDTSILPIPCPADAPDLSKAV